MRSSLRYLRRFISTLPATALFDRLLWPFVFAAARLAVLLRNRTLQRNLQFLNRRMREDHAVVPQQMIRMHFISAYQFKPIDIPRTQLEVAIVGLRCFHHEDSLVDLQRVQSFLEFLS